MNAEIHVIGLQTIIHTIIPMGHISVTSVRICVS